MLRNTTRITQILTAGLLMAIPLTSARAEQAWDLNTVNSSGSGIWNTTNTNWHTTATQTDPLTTWNPADRSRFETGSNIVTLGSDITFTGLGYITVRSDTLRVQSQLDVNNNPLYTLTLGASGQIDVQTGGASVFAAPLAGHLYFNMYRGRATTVTGPIVGATTDVRIGLAGSDSAGTGKVTLAGHASHGGGTVIAGRAMTNNTNLGILELTGSIAQSDITINAYGKLQGTSADHGLLQWNLDANDADLITVNNNGNLDLTYLDLLVDMTGLHTQTEYVLADYSGAGVAGLTGQFASITGLGSGWDIDYDGTAASGANKIVIFQVPEPSAAWILLGAAALLRRRFVNRSTQ